MIPVKLETNLSKGFEFFTEKEDENATIGFIPPLWGDKEDLAEFLSESRNAFEWESKTPFKPESIHDVNRRLERHKALSEALEILSERFLDGLTISMMREMLEDERKIAENWTKEFIKNQ